MSIATVTQLGLFGEVYPVSPDCDECECHITGKVYKGLSSETLCKDCFEDADLAVCPNCEETVEHSDLVKNPDGNEWCESCADEDTFECDSCGCRAWNDDCVTVERRRGRYGRSGTDSLCEDCADEKTTRCEDCRETIYCDDAIRTAGGYDICQGCYEDGYITCEDCGEVVHTDDSYCNDYGCYCMDCRPYGEDFHPAGFRNRSGCITEIGSARCYGIELETDECDGYSELESTGAWGAKNDCTVSGKEFYSDILSGDAGLQAVRDWGRLARRNGWNAGSSAGYHLHLDMRREDDDTLYAICYAYWATESVWLKFVESRRSSGTYSHTLRWNGSDIINAAGDQSFYSWAGRGTRYEWFNRTAYTQHETFEIRAHQGTCDEDEVINWVKAHTRFADWAATKGLADVQEALDSKTDAELFDLIADEIWQDDDLRDYYADKAREYHGIRF
jgi:hypothetical protein